MLPPISGGSPEGDEHEGGETSSPGSEAAPPPAGATAVTMEADPGEAGAGDAAPQPGESPSASESAATVAHFPVPDDWEPEPEGSDPGTGPDAGVTPEPAALVAVSAEAIAHDQAESGPVEPADAPAATGDHEPTPEPQAAGSQPESDGGASSEAAAESTGQAEGQSTAGENAAAAPVQAPGSGRPPRQGKPHGQGRGESSRGRGSRGRQPSGPPQPPSPPQPHPADAQLAQLAYVIVNEAGASVYSTSQVGRDELPEFDATLRGTISIGRRLQDPLSELVKIEPQNIGVGLYQHDVNPKQLKETLESVIASCVNFVGVDLNTASVPLLRHVSGLNQLTARRIVDFRKERGAFASRQQLMEVEGIGPATYTQAAGFLKLLDGEEPLDRTWVHPESYPSALKLLEKFGFAADVVRDKVGLPELRAQLAQADVPALASELGVGDFTLRDIIEALGRPERDPRDDLPKPIFKKGVLKLEDLTAGMELKGTVLNVVNFGAFVEHRPEGLGSGPHQPARQPIRQEPARRGERGRRGDGLGDGRGSGAEAGLADDGQAGYGAAPRPAIGLAPRRPGGRAARPEPGTRAGPGTSRGRRRTRTAPARIGADLAAGGSALGGRPGRDAGPSPRSGPGSRPGPRPRPGRPTRPGGTRRRTGTTRTRARPGGARRPARSLSRTGRRSIASFRPRSGSRSRPASTQPTSPGPPASPALQGCPGRQCPAPDVRPAQAALGSQGRGPGGRIGVHGEFCPVNPESRKRRPGDPHASGRIGPPARNLGPTARARDTGSLGVSFVPSVT